MAMESKPLTLTEVAKVLEKSDKENIRVKTTLEYVKKFTKKAKLGLKEKIEELEISKLKRQDITKLADLMPETPPEIRNILTDASLDENETEKVLSTVKEFK